MATGLRNLKQIFPNTGGLWRRIDAYTGNSSILRVALIPWGIPRKLSAPLLDALVADPLDPNEASWGEALAQRPLTKDTLVMQSPSFEYIETRNSMVQYPIPFSGPPVEYLEVDSVEDSREHIETADLHVYISESREKLPKIDFPSIQVVLGPIDNDGHKSSKPVLYHGDSFYIDMENYQHACVEFRKSPAYVSSFNDLARRSGISALKDALSDVKSIRQAMFESIIKSCEAQIEKESHILSENSQLDSEVRVLRREWATNAHRELQTDVLPSLDSILSDNLAWYKLYSRADDIEATLSEWLSWRYMPRARSGIEYVTGRIDQAVPPLLTAAASSDPQAHLNEMVTKGQLSAIGLQRKGLLAVMTALGVQIPLTLLALAGYIWGGYSLYTMTALAGLGIVVGLSRMQKIWLKAVHDLEESTKSNSINAINRTEQTLYDLYEDQVSQQKSILADQRKAVSDVKI